MKDQNERPLSTLVAQGWEVIGFSSGVDSNGSHADNILLRRQKQHKILKVRKKMLGGGVVAAELDI